MGWLWSSSSSSESSQAIGSSNTPNTPNASTQPVQAIPQQATAPSKRPTRDELAERDLQSLLQGLEADVRPSSTKYNHVPKQPPPPTNSNQTTTTVPEEERLNPLAESILPTTMSCRQAFDAAFYCQSLGGQFNNLYRYGNIRSCSEHWSDFWFCMRTRGYTGTDKEEMIRKHYREREKRRYGKEEGPGRSSEDVWKSRDKKLEWGEAFNVPEPAWYGTDEEWNQVEKDRRAGRVDGSIQ
ncbi:hypothetical protein F5884DRAFT_784156 [Xylogone sp. PMI_703]|nr:hypothetical protein F5884DRAFT_784156 [Xylogone sp. PMI_703]